MPTNLPPTLQVVTSAEARAGFVTQGGQESTKVNSKRLDEFQRAHAGKRPAVLNAPQTTQATVTQGLQGQVSVAEQTAGVLFAIAGKAHSGKSKALLAYEKLYTEDELFLEKDMESFLHALAKNEKSLADFSQASQEAIALRKYLLASLVKEQKGQKLGDEQQNQVDVLLEQLNAEYGDYIHSTLAALETLNESPRAFKIGVQEFISAYHAMGAQEGQDEDVLEAMLAIFMSIRKKKRADGSDEALGEYIMGSLEGFEKTLRREVGTHASKVALSRQYTIFKRINSLRLLHMVFVMHKRYLNQLRKAKEPLSNIPKLDILMEACIQALGDEVHSGCNMLVSLMADIQTPTKSAGNACMALYMATVMTPRALQRICHNNTQHRMVRDILHDAMLKDGVLTLKRKYS